MENELRIVEKHTQEAPVDLGAIFADLNVDFCMQPILTGESGWIERNGDAYRVTVNANDPEQRRRFTSAHELAHYLLHRDLMDHGSRMNRHTDRLFDGSELNREAPFKHSHEVQANRLAAQILMPARLVRRLASEGLDVEQLARRMGVSKAAMSIRLSSLGLAS